MTRDTPGPSRYRSLLSSRRALAGAAPLVRYGVFSVGVSLFLGQVRPLVSDAQFTWGERRVMGAIVIVLILFLLSQVKVKTIDFLDGLKRVQTKRKNAGG